MTKRKEDGTMISDKFMEFRYWEDSRGRPCFVVHEIDTVPRIVIDLNEGFNEDTTVGILSHETIHYALNKMGIEGILHRLMGWDIPIPTPLNRKLLHDDYSRHPEGLPIGLSYNEVLDLQVCDLERLSKACEVCDKIDHTIFIHPYDDLEPFGHPVRWICTTCYEEGQYDIT